MLTRRYKNSNVAQQKAEEGAGRRNVQQRSLTEGRTERDKSSSKFEWVPAQRCWRWDANNLAAVLARECMWAVVFIVVSLALILVGHYERRVRVLESTPQTRIRLVPRTYYEEQLGVKWSTDGDDTHGSYPIAGDSIIPVVDPDPTPGTKDSGNLDPPVHIQLKSYSRVPPSTDAKFTS